MADQPISRLPVALSLTGLELIPIVQNGVTKQAQVSQIMPQVNITYPGVGIPYSTGSSWGTSYPTIGSGSIVLSETPTINNPNLTGNISANVNLRNGNLDNLLQLAGGTSEVGYATDTDSLVLFTGTAGQARVNGNYGNGITKVFTLTSANYAQYATGLSQFSGTITGFTLTASNVLQTINIGGEMLFNGVTAGTTIVSQLTGTTGQSGTYEISNSHSVPSIIPMSSFTGSYLDCNHVSYLQVVLDASLYNGAPYYDFKYGSLPNLNIRLPSSNEISELRVVWNMGQSTPKDGSSYTFSSSFSYALAYQASEPGPSYSPIPSDWSGSPTIVWYPSTLPTISDITNTIAATPNVTFTNSQKKQWTRYARIGEGANGISTGPAKIGYSFTFPNYNSTMTGTGVTVTSTTGQLQAVIASTAQTPLAVNQQILVTGTLTGTATGITTGTTYYVIATSSTTSTSTFAVTTLFTLSATLGGAAITTTAGTTSGLTFTALMPIGTTTAITQTIPMGVWLVSGYAEIINPTATAFASGEINITLANGSNAISTATTGIRFVKTYNIPANSRESITLPTRTFNNSSVISTSTVYTLYNVASITSGVANIIINPRFTRIA